MQNELKELKERLASLEPQSQVDSTTTSINVLEEKEKLHHKQTCALEERIASLQQQLDESRCNNQHSYHLGELEEQVIQLQQQQPNWERQISEIIDWVANEKEARNYLQQMAATMTKELDNLKKQHEMQRGRLIEENERMMQLISSPNCNSNGKSFNFNTYGTTTWQERRSARVDKQELLQLQLDLANEIEDKQRIQLDLTRVQKELQAALQDLNETRSEIIKIQEQKNKSHAPQSTVIPSCSLFQSNNTNQSNLSSHSSSSSNCSPLKNSKICISAPLENVIESEMSENDDSTTTEDHSSLSDLKNHSQIKKHSFIIRTFVAPLKCNHCTSLMVGLIRQGLVCEVCGFACHVACADQGQQQCPCDDSRQRPVGIDPQKGIGTAYEGYVKIPRARGGVRKGWVRMFVVVCDFKLFLYDLNSPGDLSGMASASGSSNGSTGDGVSSGMSVVPFVSVNTLIDMRYVNLFLSTIHRSLLELLAPFLTIICQYSLLFVFLPT